MLFGHLAQLFGKQAIRLFFVAEHLFHQRNALLQALFYFALRGNRVCSELKARLGVEAAVRGLTDSAAIAQSMRFVHSESVLAATVQESHILEALLRRIAFAKVWLLGVPVKATHDSLVRDY